MKKGLLIVVVLLLVLDIFLNLVRYRDHDEQINDMYHHIDSVMHHRSMLDSMYWDHLEVCKFELKEGIVAVEN